MQPVDGIRSFPRAAFQALPAIEPHIETGLLRLRAESTLLAEVVQQCLLVDPSVRVSSAAALQQLRPLHTQLHVRVRVGARCPVP
jgi:hypothetical protein